MNSIELKDLDLDNDELPIQCSQSYSSISNHHNHPPPPSTTAIENLIIQKYKESSIINTLIPSLSSFKDTILTIVENHIKVTNIANDNLNKSNCILTSDDVTFEILIENERGLNLCGYQLFSSTLLIPRIDPISRFVDTKGCTIGDDLRLYSSNCVDIGFDDETGIKWRWSWGQWYVLCFNSDISSATIDRHTEEEEEQEEDVENQARSSNKRAVFCDYQGWFYSKHFNQKRYKWSGEFNFIRGSFCRRRLLIRLKEKVR